MCILSSPRVTHQGAAERESRNLDAVLIRVVHCIRRVTWGMLTQHGVAVRQKLSFSGSEHTANLPKKDENCVCRPAAALIL